MSRRGRGQSSYIELVHGPITAFIKFSINVKLDRLKRSSLEKDPTGAQSATPGAVLLSCANCRTEKLLRLKRFRA